MDTIKLHSSIKLTVNGPMKVRKKDIQVNKEGKYDSVVPTWHGPKNRVELLVGQNIVPAGCLEWAAIKKLQKKGLITIDSSGLTAKAKKAVKAKAVKPEPKVEDEIVDELPKAKKPVKKATK